jgi:hypothetical protein
MKNEKWKMKNIKQKISNEESWVMKNFSFFTSMDGAYAENRLERFQCTFHFSLMPKDSHVC